MRTAIHLALKDLNLLWRDKLGLFWVLAFPIIMATLFGSIYSGMGGKASNEMKVAVVNNDVSDAGKAYIERLNASEAIEVVPMEEQAARDAVRKGNATAFLVVPAGFVESLSFFSASTNGLEVGIDPGRRAEAGYLQGIIAETTYRTMQEAFTNPTRMKSMIHDVQQDLADADQVSGAQKLVFSAFFSSVETFLDNVDPENYERGTLGDPAPIKTTAVENERMKLPSAFAISFPSAIMWGLMGCSAGFAITLVKERKAGTLLRLKVSPVSQFTVLAGKGTACFIGCSVVVVLLMSLAVVAFGVEVGDWMQLAAATFASALAFVGIMMLLSVTGKTEEAVAGAGWGILIIMAMFGGGMVPLLFMPRWMAAISNYSPVKWGVLALEGATWRGFSWAEAAPGLIILCGVGIAAFVAGWAIYRRSEG